MKQFEFEQTSIPSQYSINLKDNLNMVWLDSRTADMYRILFVTTAMVLKHHQSKDAKRIGMTIKDEKGNFKMGAILIYKEPEEGSEEDSGNWYLEFTLDPEDMTDLSIDIDNHSDVFQRCAAYSANSICYARFRNVELMHSMFNCAIDTLVQFLDTNANEAEDIDVTLRGIFTASVAVEDGKKVMSIIPGENVKQIIKDDAAL